MTLFIFLQKSMDLKEACVFHLCITFTSASVKSGIHLSPVSDRVDKTPNGWLTEWVSSVPIRRKTLSAFAVSILAGMYMSGCQSFSFWVQNICVTFHVTSMSQCVKTVSSYVIFMCLCTMYAHVTSCIDMVHCRLCANGYWHYVMCICFSVYPCAYMKHLKVNVSEQCTEVLLISINGLMLH